MLLAFYCGADTVDTQTRILSVAFKQAQMPGYYITRLSYQERLKDSQKYETVRNQFAEHLLQLVDDGFCVNGWDTEEAWPISSHADAHKYVDYLEDQDGINQIHARACHNLYSSNFEAEVYRNILAHGNIEDFIRNRVKKTAYSKVFEYAVSQKNEG